MSLCTFLTLKLTTIIFFTVQIRLLLKITNDLIDICYESHDCHNEMRFKQAADELVELRDILEKLRRAVATNGDHQVGIRPSVDVVNGLLSKCRDEINQIETMLSGRKRIKGPSSSFDLQATLTGLASSTTALKGILEENLRCVHTFMEKSNADNIHM